jgi:hypothetical protein
MTKRQPKENQQQHLEPQSTQRTQRNRGRRTNAAAIWVLEFLTFNLSRFVGVSVGVAEAGARRRNPERSEGSGLELPNYQITQLPNFRHGKRCCLNLLNVQT